MPDDPALDKATAIVRSMSDLLTQQSLIAIDLADYRSVLTNAGGAHFGEAEAEGPDRAIRAAEAAVRDLLENARRA